MFEHLKDIEARDRRMQLALIPFAILLVLLLVLGLMFVFYL